MDHSSTYNLKVLAPKIAKQWHPTKNGKLRPDQVTPGSNRKVWWMCSKGHEWQVTINNRVQNNSGCPYCSGRRASREYNLSATNPEVAKQWHPTKNGKLRPDQVTPGSGRKVWWVCVKGHEWQSAILKRTINKRACPYCSKRRASKEYNLSTANQEIAKQWHPTKNGKLRPDEVTPGSGRKIWWMCGKGHEWQATIIDRTKYNTGCPYCSRRRANKEYNFSLTNPEIAKQWHPVKNGNLTPDQVIPGAKRKVWWICSKGHEWQAVVAARTRYNEGCPYCSGRKASKEYNVSAVNPEIAKQWHPTKNGKLRPDQVTPGSSRKFWWICSKGHEWQELIINRNKGNCPYCSGRRASKEYNLLVLHPEVAKQWHPTKNGTLTPGKVSPRAGLKVWWLCDMGHEWRTSVIIRTYAKSGCPICSSLTATKEHNLRVHRPDIADQWHPNKNSSTWPEHVTPLSNKKVWWMCDEGHEWQDVIRNRTIYGSDCPYCDHMDGYKEYNLLSLHPEVARQWHPTKNHALRPEDVTPGSKRKVWWLCDKGHEWRATVNSRTLRNINCPYCWGRYASSEYNLQIKYPQIAKQWHPVKNGKLKPDNVTPGSGRKVWWTCDKGHEWRAVVHNRIKGSGCPYCYLQNKKKRAQK